MRTTKTIALVLAAIMLAAALSACSVNNPNYTVLKVGDMNIGVNAYYNNYNYLAQVYSMYGLYNVSTPEAFKRMQDQVFDNLINNALPVVVAKQNGVTLTEEEEAQVQADFKEQIDQMIAQYASQVDESITDEDAKYAEEEKLFKAALKSSGWNYNTYLKMIEDDVRGAAIGNKYMESLYSGVNVTEEDAKAYYDEQLAAKKAEYAETPAQFYTDYSNAISGSDTDLGTVTSPPSMAYTVNDQDTDDELTVVESLDGNEIRTIEDAVRNQTYTFALTEAQFAALSNGQHTMQVKVTDTLGNSATRTTTFTRSVTGIEYIVGPIETDAAAEKILVSLQYYAAAEDVVASVCNNAFDDNPTWELATIGLKHIFSNATKTAEKWGVGVKVQISKSTGYDTISSRPVSGSYV